MINDPGRYALEFERIGREALDLLHRVPESALHRPFPTTASYSLFVLATYLVEVGEFWVLGQVGRRFVSSRSLAEFCATGTLAELEARYERWLQAVHEVLDDLPDNALEQFTAYPLVAGNIPLGGPVTVRDCLLQAITHISLLLEHLQRLYASLISEYGPSSSSPPGTKPASEK